MIHKKKSHFINENNKHSIYYKPLSFIGLLINQIKTSNKKCLYKKLY